MRDEGTQGGEATTDLRTWDETTVDTRRASRRALQRRRFDRVLTVTACILAAFLPFNLALGKYLTAAANVGTGVILGLTWLWYARDRDRRLDAAGHILGVAVLAFGLALPAILNGGLHAEDIGMIVVYPFGAGLILGYRKAAAYTALAVLALVAIALVAPHVRPETSDLDPDVTLLVSLAIGTCIGGFGWSTISGRTQEAQVDELTANEALIRRQADELERQRDLLATHNDELAAARDEAVRNALELDGARRALEDMNLQLEQRVAARTAELLRNRGDVDAAALADENRELRARVAAAESADREAAASTLTAVPTTPTRTSGIATRPGHPHLHVVARANPADATVGPIAARDATGRNAPAAADAIDAELTERRIRNSMYAIVGLVLVVVLRAVANVVAADLATAAIDLALGVGVCTVGWWCGKNPDRWKYGRHILLSVITLAVSASAFNLGPIPIFFAVPVALLVMAIGTPREAIVWTGIAAFGMVTVTVGLTVVEGRPFDYLLLSLQLALLVFTSELALAVQGQLAHTLTRVRASSAELGARNAELAREHAAAVTARQAAERAEAEAVRTNAALEGAQAALRTMAQSLEDRVTERTAELILANSDLEAERDTLSEVMAAVPFGLFVLAADGTLTAQNAEAAVVFGAPLDDAAELADRLGLDLTALVTHGEAFVDEDRLATTADASVLPVAVLVQPIRSDDGARHGAVVAVRDMSQARQAEAESRHADKLADMGRLAAGIAHEINTPIQYVRDNLQFTRDGLADLIASLALDPATGTTTGTGPGPDPFLLTEIPLALDEAVTGTDRVAEIVRAVKTFSHPGSSTPELADLNVAVRSTATIARNETKYVADVDLDLDPDLPRVTCWIGDLNQVVLNLVVNAAHAIDDSGRERGLITICTRFDADADAAVVSITDDGCGMPADVRTKIFEPFFTTKEAGRGTGQGLPLAKRLVEKHGGTISVDSEQGCGTTFTLRIPRHAPAVTAAAPPATTST